MSSERWTYKGDFSDPSSRAPVIVIDQCVSSSIADTLHGKGYRVITPWGTRIPDDEFVDLSKQYPVSIVLTRDKGRTFREYEFAAIFPPSYKGDDIIRITDAIFGKDGRKLPENNNGHNGNGNGRRKKGFDPKERWIEISKSVQELYSTDSTQA
ncbi:MAG: hypothetical protein V1731_01965 [Candidatus Aenigmatarchaeota archaeon]